MKKGFQPAGTTAAYLRAFTNETEPKAQLPKEPEKPKDEK
jgi:hypothetical protein